MTYKYWDKRIAVRMTWLYNYIKIRFKWKNIAYTGVSIGAWGVLDAIIVLLRKEYEFNWYIIFKSKVDVACTYVYYLIAGYIIEAFKLIYLLITKCLVLIIKTIYQGIIYTLCKLWLIRDLLIIFPDIFSNYLLTLISLVIVRLMLLSGSKVKYVNIIQLEYIFYILVIMLIIVRLNLFLIVIILSGVSRIIFIIIYIKQII